MPQNPVISKQTLSISNRCLWQKVCSAIREKIRSLQKLFHCTKLEPVVAATTKTVQHPSKQQTKNLGRDRPKNTYLWSTRWIGIKKNAQVLMMLRNNKRNDALAARVSRFIVKARIYNDKFSGCCKNWNEQTR